MGGGFFEGGNITPAAEFNIYVDPQAADVVLQSGIPIVMMPLDVTHKALTTRGAHRRHSARSARGSARRRPRCWSSSSGSTRRNTAPTAARCTTPASSPICCGRSCSRAGYATSSMETASELTMGMTVIDWWRVTNERPRTPR